MCGIVGFSSHKICACGPLLNGLRRLEYRGYDSAGDKGAARHCNDVIFVPRTSTACAPIVTAVALQLFAYHLARIRGCEIDQPRNLAKSVTVE